MPSLVVVCFAALSANYLCHMRDAKQTPAPSSQVEGTRAGAGAEAEAAGNAIKVSNKRWK